MKKMLFALVMGVVMVIPASAGVYGSLANFDVVNDTGQTAHGFEIDIEGISSGDITSLFGAANRWPGMERYGSPTVSTTPTGVKIVYEATYSGGWSAGTPSGTLPVSPSDSCWPYGAPNYGPNYPCDHFGVSTSVSTPNVTYKWLVETSPGASSLTPVLATVPNPVWTVVPVIINNVPQPPAVNVVIVAPQPLGYEFGEPRWVKVTATGVMQDLAVEDLMAENAVLKQAQTQVQLEWQLLQVDSGNPGSGQIDLTGVALDAGAMGVVYRFEFYKYTGQRDPLTNEALAGPNGDTPGAIGPSAGDLGAFVVAQNAGINFDGKIPPAPPLPIAPTLNASIGGAQYGLPYSQVIDATPGNPGDVLTFSVTGMPAGLTLTGNTISGTPTSVGTFPLVITVTDVTNGTSTSGSTNLVVGDSPITFPNPFTLAPGTVGTPYSQAINITGGVPPYTFTDATNQLVTVGLSLMGNAITGTPTTVGSPSITIQATDHLGFSQSATATLTVSAAGGPPVACFATNKVITSVGATTIDIGGGKGNPGGQTATIPGSINYIAPASSLANGELATFTGTVDKQGNCTAITLTVAPGLSLGSPSALPDGQVGVAYTTTAVTPAGGVGPFTISVSGIPQALSFDGTSISGTPATGMNGVYTIVVSVSDSVGETVHTNFTLKITAPAALVLGAINLPAVGYAGFAYAGSASAKGGNPALTWTAVGLPVGVSIAADGTISGIPASAGVYSVTMIVTDNIGMAKSASRTLTIRTVAPLVLGRIGLPATGYVGHIYLGSTTASGGVSSRTWSATGLPNGVFITAPGGIAGMPLSNGIFDVTLSVQDKLGQVATFNQTVTINLVPAIVVGTVNLPNALIKTIYRGSVSATGGVGSLRWTGTNLPPGVKVSSAGVILGIPTVSGVFATVLTVTDTFAQTQSVNANISISDLALSTSASSVTATRAATTPVSITVSALSGFNASVALAVSGLPRNCTATFSPAAVTRAGPSTLNLTPAITTPTGTYTLTITGKSGTQVRAAPLMLTVQ